MELGASLAGGARARGALLVATDFDGTLAPIAPDPDAVRTVPAAVDALAWLSRPGAATGREAAVPVRLAIVTSRDVDDVTRHLRLGPEATVVGCAGLEVLADGRAAVHPEAVPLLPRLAEATERVAAELARGRVPGARLERKRCGTVVHTRGLAEDADAGALALARSVAELTGMRVVIAKRAVELRPPLDIDKADAVAALRDGTWEAAALVAAGDDLPDVAMLDLAATTPGGAAIAVADVETPATVLEVAGVAVEGPWGWGAALAELVRRLSGAAAGAAG